MSEAEAVQKLDALKHVDDGQMYLSNEDDHKAADGILLDFLRANGNGALADAFDRARERLDFWYS